MQKYSLLSVMTASAVASILGIAAFMFATDTKTLCNNELLNAMWTSLFLCIILLLFQIFMLYRQQRAARGAVILLELDRNGNFNAINEIPEHELIGYCREKFQMEFSIEYWPALRSRLLAERKKETPSGKEAERIYQEGCAISSDFVAMVKYRDGCYDRSFLAALHQVPTQSDAAIEITRNCISGVLVFHNPQELLIWEHELPENKRPAFHQPIMQFLKKRQQDYETL